jgi:hypothetical protein
MSTFNAPILSLSTGLLLLGILDAYLFISTAAYVPISKRLPFAVLVELIGSLILSNATLLTASFGVSDSIFGNCRIVLVVLFGGHLIFISVGIRFGWLIMKDFLTKKMIRSRDSESQMSEENLPRCYTGNDSGVCGNQCLVSNIACRQKLLQTEEEQRSN